MPTRIDAKALRALLKLLKRTGQPLPQEIVQQGAKRSKFKNNPQQTPDGYFQSQHEHNRWGDLLLLQRNREIRDLRRQVTYSLDLYCVHICSYIADFVYWDIKASCEVVEDAKGFVTPEYRIKRNLMLAIYGIEIREV